jgi:hypothetical protein
LPQSGATVVAVGAVVVVWVPPDAELDPWVELQPATTASTSTITATTVPIGPRTLRLIGIP